MWNKLPSGYTTVTIPTFSFDIDQVGGSAHVDSILPLYGYKGAANYTVYEDEMGFNAEGTFIVPAGWGPMANCVVIMHGISTSVPYVPPKP